MLPNVRGPVSAAYGSLLLEAAPASIGWIGSTENMLRFSSLIAGESNCATPINKASIETMFAKPNLPCWKNKQEFFGLGWEVEQDKSGKMIAFSRHRSLPGLMTLVEHQTNGLTWAAAFNARPYAYESTREEAKRIIKSAMKKLLPSLTKHKD